MSRLLLITRFLLCTKDALANPAFEDTEFNEDAPEEKTTDKDGTNNAS
jgi:hypothetical protein